MNTRQKYLQIVGNSPALSEHTRQTLLQHVDEVPEEVQQAIATAVAVLERRLIEALEEHATEV